jgi:hypothetical protein
MLIPGLEPKEASAGSRTTLLHETTVLCASPHGVEKLKITDNSDKLIANFRVKMSLKIEGNVSNFYDFYNVAIL